MDIKPANTILICSDQHNPFISGFAGDSTVATPNLDRLATAGTVFTQAYTPSPICVSARACMATGRYVHEIDAWDNAAPYSGESAASWGHRLSEQGHTVTTIGKLHYRSQDDPTGFADQRIPMHVAQGQGNLFGLLREDMPSLPQFRSQILDAAAGDSKYTRYDREVAQQAVDWLHNESPMLEDPWALVVSFTLPHPPFMVPAAYAKDYQPEEIRLRPNWEPEHWSRHSEMQWLRQQQQLTEPFAEATIRRATAIYYGMVSFLDAQVGRVLDALDSLGLWDTTRVIYTSDHGEMLGEQGLWFKCCMYEGSVRVPLILCGPDVPTGTCDSPVSLIDLFPTLLESVGATPTSADADLQGWSLLQTAHHNVRERTILSEFHAALSRTGSFMIRWGQWKYIVHVGADSQLFDLNADPQEIHDLSQQADYAKIIQLCERQLRAMIDPDAIDRQARRHQAQRLQAHGGAVAIRKQGFKIPFTPPPEVH